ncbi:Na/Pi cotransporter family protein [Pseudoalteromonas sp. T1lg22]|uniref:Na/Pi cotransporter family protein n=1 Tax=Pseudoalteromonas sp. T1lg22 TaxID=2077096 RepID=UPI000CF65AD7|nr:Na/Pi symporter [Pseudoalteromonas sp. T1lg22]
MTMIETYHLLKALGGLGLFLLGMTIMTDALYQLAGQRIRNALMSLTRSPVSGACTGACSTAILQSSSATTVAAVGFVSAGLLTFKESLGIIFGANVGTTITGWLVVLIGFKLQLTSLILPLLLFAMVAKLFLKGKRASLAMAVAGFSVIFVGIGMMQSGLSGFEQVLTPETFGPDTWLGRIQLLLLGVAITLVTQSSSAGVAASLTALYAGSINFHQAAALIIGMDLGTTVTALVATLGGSVASRRTGLSHVIYNVLTAMMALLLITPFVHLWQWLFTQSIETQAQLALVAFHTLFNVLGLFLVLPFTNQFEHLMRMLVPQRGQSYTEALDNTLLRDVDLALKTVHASVYWQFHDLLCYLRTRLKPGDFVNAPPFPELQSALDETHVYVDLIHLQQKDKPSWSQLLELIHILDHMQRLHERCKVLGDDPWYDRGGELIMRNGHFSALLINTEQALNNMMLSINEGDNLRLWQQAQSLGDEVDNELARARAQRMHDIAVGRLGVPEAEDYLEQYRHLQKTIYHIRRVCLHLNRWQEIK